MEKKCTKCGETKLLSEYHKHKTAKYGRKARCKECRNAYDKAYKRSEAGKARKKAYRESEAGKAYQKSYKKEYMKTEKIKAYHKAYMKNRRHNDPVFKLQCRLRSGFCDWIKGNRKTCRTEQYVGCTYKELLEHLESQFDEGMTWENHGRGDNKWHIDHIKAQSRFDPTDEEEKYMCWHYTNLQPMWSSENIKYSNKSKPGDENRIWMGREIGWVITS
jgi:hypothetical protein